MPRGGLKPLPLKPILEDMQQLSNKLNELDPMVYTTLTNKLGQTIDLLEHPLKGDEAPVIARYVDPSGNVFLYDTEFFDTDDLTGGDDYEPVFAHGGMYCSYEID